MDIRDSLKSQFGDLGYAVDDSTLDKCVEICVLYNIDEETFVETWAAYSVTHLEGQDPTVELVEKMERKELANIKDKRVSSNTQQTTPLLIYNNKTPTSNKRTSGDQSNNQDTTPKERKIAKQLVSTPVSSFSPASFSPLSTTPFGKYSGRSNAGQVVAEFSERAHGDWTGKDKIPLSIGPYCDEMLLSRCRMMFEPLSDKMYVLKDVIDRIGLHIAEVNQLTEISTNCCPSQVEIACVGRVCCDSDGRLNASSVLLESALGQCLPLDLSSLPTYALFPGQVIAVRGINPTGKRFIVKQLFCNALLPPPLALPTFNGTLEIIVASGPFTQTDSLSYEPLKDLMSHVIAHRPHLLLLTGPLVDLRQSQLTAGNIADTYQAQHDKIISNISDQLKGSWTRVVVVACSADAACLPVYPTPPPLSPLSAVPLHMVSDPSLLSINGLVIGATATDSLMHLSKEEITQPAGGSDRLGRLAAHLLQQQSFYPLHPSSEELCVDLELWETHATLPVTPHILIVPSSFRFFIKPVHNCLVINPEHLVKGESGGVFARLEVGSPTDGAWSPSTHISAQILKI